MGRRVLYNIVKCICACVRGVFWTSLLMLRGFLRSLFKSRMDVTTANFDSALIEEFRSSINSSSFISVDSEFSGLSLDSNFPSTYLDTPEERYANYIRPATESFIVFQFGVSAFEKESSGKNSYLNKTWNFYVWGRSSPPIIPDSRYVFQTSSIDFLSSAGFNFNKLFREGIPYLRESDASRYREILIERHNGTSVQEYPSVSIPPEQEEFLASMRKRVQEYLDSSSTLPLEIPNCNGFQRKLLYQTLKEEFGDQVYLETVKKSDFQLVLSVVKWSKEKREESMNFKKKKDWTEFEDAVGFTKIIQILSESRKPIVGHNMLLDLCFTLHQFLAPLPEDYNDFKALCRDRFPYLFDTKAMASAVPLKNFIPNSTLKLLRERLAEEPFILPEISSKCSFSDTVNYHEAGFDAYMTGECFIAMSEYLMRKGTSEKMKSRVLDAFQNKIPISRIYDIPYLNFDGEDILPDRSHVFHLKFPAIWKANDIKSLFLPFGNIQIYWIDDTSAYVSLYQKEYSDEIMKTLSSSSCYSIRPYTFSSKYISTTITPLLQKSNLSPSPAPKKKRSISPCENPTPTLKRSKSTAETSRIKKPFQESSDWE